jgi:hypothetical protein
MLVRRLPALCLCLLVFLPFALGQHVPPSPRLPAPTSPETEGIEREQQKALQKRNYEQLKADTDKLLKLATELKAYVDKTDENVLSYDVVKKAEQIEKLAHSVKEKMKGQ